MKYTVKHYHRKLFGYKGIEDIMAPDEPTIYTIEAETPLQAAKMAHAMHNDCHDFTTGGECRTAFERLTDDIFEDKEAYRAFGKHDGYRLYRYDDVYGHKIVVYI